MRRPGLLAVAVAVAACGPSIHVDSLKAPGTPVNSGQSYSWRSGSGGVHGGAMTADNPILDENIRSIIDEELEAHGFHRTEGQSDLGVAYVAAVERQMSVTEVDDFLRYRRRTYVLSSTDVRQFDAGSLIIDVTDGSTGDLLWRGSAETGLHRDDRDYRESKLREGVAAIVEALSKSSAVSEGS